MRFAAPSRSPSPPPTRGRQTPRKSILKSPGSAKKSPGSTSAFGLRNLSDSEDDRRGFMAHSDAESSSSDSFCYASESEVPLRPRNPTPIKRTAAEQMEINDTLAAIRLRTRHQDPLEDWERKTRKEAFQVAYEKTRRAKSSLFALHLTATKLTSEKIQASHVEQMAQVQSILQSLSIKHRADEERLRVEWAERDRRLWEGIEAVIAKEEKKARDAQAQAEAEVRRIQEQQENDMKRQREAEEKKQRDAAEEALRQELARKKKAKEEQDDKDAKEKEARVKTESQRTESERMAAGLTTAEEDWVEAQSGLQSIKGIALKAVKENSEMKREWGKYRRQITPKIGQVTNSETEIRRISEQLLVILCPTPPLPEPLYTGLLSSLAKGFLLQAETEVTAKASTSLPLAKVAANMILKVPGFALALWAKLTQRAGGWVMAKFVRNDPSLSTLENQKLIGARANENTTDYRSRVMGLMTFYFAILVSPSPEPLPPQYRPGRIWIYLSRLMSEAILLRDPLAPSLIKTLLELGGELGLKTWGRQWMKLLYVVSDAMKRGDIMGGPGVEGTAGRVRVGVELEKMFQLAGIPPP